MPGPKASGVIVLGMHRSGTSAVTRTLNLFGLSASAAEDLIGPGPGNERGHWESESLMQCNERLLGAVGASWYRPPAAGGLWLRRPEVQALKPLCRAAFERAHPTPGWVWKDPRTCLTLDFWLDLVQRPALVLVLRHPVDIAQSLQHRNGIPLQYGVALWEHYIREVLRGIRGHPVLVIRFDDLIDETDATLDGIGAMLSAVNVGNLESDRGEIHRNLERGLRHHARTAGTGPDMLAQEQLELLSVVQGISGFHPVFPALDLPAESAGAVALAAYSQYPGG